MYLLDYEIGLEIYRRLRKEDARRPTEEDVIDIPIAGDKAVLLSGVWVDVASGAVVARVGYECTTDPVFHVARAR